MPFILLKWSGASIFTDEYIRSITSPINRSGSYHIAPQFAVLSATYTHIGAFIVVVVQAPFAPNLNRAEQDMRWQIKLANNRRNVIKYR